MNKDRYLFLVIGVVAVVALSLLATVVFLHLID